MVTIVSIRKGDMVGRHWFMVRGRRPTSYLPSQSSSSMQWLVAQHDTGGIFIYLAGSLLFQMGLCITLDGSLLFQLYKTKAKHRYVPDTHVTTFSLLVNTFSLSGNTFSLLVNTFSLLVNTFSLLDIEDLVVLLTQMSLLLIQRAIKLHNPEARAMKLPRFSCLWSDIIKKVGRISRPKSPQKAAKGPLYQRQFGENVLRATKLLPSNFYRTIGTTSDSRQWLGRQVGRQVGS